MPIVSPSPFLCAPIAAAPRRSLHCAAPRKAQG